MHVSLDLSNKKSLYNIYYKTKPNGKKRKICAPKIELKSKQSELAKRLTETCILPDCVHGFVEGRSTATLAQNHTNKDWVITIDIKDFFPSILKPMVLCAGLSEYEAELATLDGRLVQGSPCSPILSNMVFKDIDLKLSKMFRRVHVSYDRFADDLVISGNGKPKWKYVNRIKEICALHGFTVNTSKTKFMFKNNEQRVLGITVNNKVSINHKTRKMLKNKMKYEGVNQKDIGYLSYINAICKEQYIRLKS